MAAEQEGGRLDGWSRSTTTLKMFLNMSLVMEARQRLDVGGGLLLDSCLRGQSEAPTLMTPLSGQRMSSNDPHQAIADVLQKRDFDAFVGLSESLHLEVKSQDYPATPKGRFELAKDVSAFANAEGGHLIIGFVTTKSENTVLDTIATLSPGADNDFVSRTIGILKDFVYPRIKGAKVEWIPSLDDVTVGFGVVYIPRQAESDQPFIITSIFVDDEVQSGAVVGMVRRKDSSNVPLSPVELQRYLQQGHDPSTRRLQRIEEAVDTLLSKSLTGGPPPVNAALAELPSRLASLLTDAT